MPVYNERLSGGKGKLLGDETSLSSNKHQALFETLFGILDALLAALKAGGTCPYSRQIGAPSVAPAHRAVGEATDVLMPAAVPRIAGDAVRRLFDV